MIHQIESTTPHPVSSTLDRSRLTRLLTLVLVGCAAALSVACGGGGDSIPAPDNDVAVKPTASSVATMVVDAPQQVRESARAVTLTGRLPTAVEFMDWAQVNFPSLFPANGASATQSTSGYSYRSYAATDMALGVRVDGSVQAVLGVSSTNPRTVSLGSLSQFACSVLPSECSATVPLAQKAGALATAIGKPKRFLIGLGTARLADVQAQQIKPDIWDFYLVGASAGNDWRTWNLPDGAFVSVFANDADTLGAVPMFTLYQMATYGDGNISVIADGAFMTRYWDNVRVMYERMASYGKPVLVNFEPDFWGYAYQRSRDPTAQFAHVGSVNPHCSQLPNSVAGLGRCLVQMARLIAPNARVGFPPTLWASIVRNDLQFMRAVGADIADFVVMQTSDRDAGCFEVLYSGSGANCNRGEPMPVYWDSTNLTSPHFTDHLSVAAFYHQNLALPVLWWQTPLGVPSNTPGGSIYAFRDNRAPYFLTRTSELVAAGGVGAVFSPGHVTQTNITTDGGQFRRLSSAYLAQPVALP